MEKKKSPNYAYFVLAVNLATSNKERNLEVVTNLLSSS